MSERALTDAIARRVVSGTARITAENDQPPAERLVGMLTAYIPTALVALFVPVWAGISSGLLADPPRLAMDDQLRFLFALGASLLSALYVWGVGYSKAVTKAKKENRPAPGRRDTFRKAWLEVVSAGGAMLVWATMMPASWLHMTDPAQPMLMGTVAVVVLAIIALFAGGEERPDPEGFQGSLKIGGTTGTE